MRVYEEDLGNMGFSCDLDIKDDGAVEMYVVHWGDYLKELYGDFDIEHWVTVPPKEQLKLLDRLITLNELDRKNLKWMKSSNTPLSEKVCFLIARNFNNEADFREFLEANGIGFASSVY